MSDTKFRWVKVAENIQEITFGTNNIAELQLEERSICIARFNDLLFAFVPKCPHASGFLVEGYIDPLGNIVCPLHRYKFCLKNGRNISGEGYYLKHWPVEVREEGVFVGFEKNKLFGLF